MFYITDNDRPLRGRRLTWPEFERLTGRPRPDYRAANDNAPRQKEEKEAA